MCIRDSNSTIFFTINNIDFPPTYGSTDLCYLLASYNGHPASGACNVAANQQFMVGNGCGKGLDGDIYTVGILARNCVVPGIDCFLPSSYFDATRITVTVNWAQSLFC